MPIRMPLSEIARCHAIMVGASGRSCAMTRAALPTTCAGGRGVIDTQMLRERRVKAEQRAHLAREVVETILLTALIFLVVHFSIQSRPVNTPSMEPGLQPQQSIVVNSLAYLFSAPRRGDVIILHHHHIPADAADLPNGCSVDNGTNGKFMTCAYVKRVIGIPGDTIQITPIQGIVCGAVLNADNDIQWPTSVRPNGA